VALLGLVLLVAAVLASHTFLAGRTPKSRSIVIDLGSASQIKFSDAWQRIGEAGSFDAGTAQIEGMCLFFTPSGALDNVWLEALTRDNQLVSVGWEGTGGPADQNVHMSGGIGTFAQGQAPQSSAPSLAETLAAVDRAGVKNMIEKLPAEPSGTRYSVASLRDQNHHGPGISAQDPAYIWTDVGLVALAADDDRRSFDSSSAYLAVSAMVPVSSPSTSLRQGSSSATATTMLSRGGSSPLVVYFVIPVATAPSPPSTQATEPATSDSSVSDSEQIRSKALSALEKVAAWKVTLVDNNDTTYTDWWSANSPYYRWDTVVGGKTSSNAVDGKTHMETGPNGSARGWPLGADAGHPANPTVFSTYYWYLKEGSPISIEGSSGNPATIRITLKNAPSSPSVLVAADSYLPVEFDTKSEETAQRAKFTGSAVPITRSELKAAVEEVRAVLILPVPSDATTSTSGADGD